MIAFLILLPFNTESAYTALQYTARITRAWESVVCLVSTREFTSPVNTFAKRNVSREACAASPRPKQVAAPHLLRRRSTMSKRERTEKHSAKPRVPKEMLASLLDVSC